MAKAANGSGTIRERSDGRWEGRYSTGRDPGTGEWLQKSVYGKTQSEVAQKLRKIVAEIDESTYIEPSKITVSQWLDTWSSDYLNDVKPRTVESYNSKIKHNIKPYIGSVKLCKLTAPQIQNLYKTLLTKKKPLSSKTVSCVHGILHEALDQAVSVHYIKLNPSDACKPPKIDHKEIRPLEESDVSKYLQAIASDKFSDVLFVDIFTGLRQSEIIGLTWDCVDLNTGSITVKSQLQKSHTDSGYFTGTPKNNKIRVLKPAKDVMDIIKSQRTKQIEARLKAGPAWIGSNYVFTDELGCHLKHRTVYNHFKKIIKSIGIPNARFHDLRHTFAVLSIIAGDDIKTVQRNMGHYSASFTLDTYGHVTEQMQQRSSDRMEAQIMKLKTDKKSLDV